MLNPVDWVRSWRTAPAWSSRRRRGLRQTPPTNLPPQPPLRGVILSPGFIQPPPQLRAPPPRLLPLHGDLLRRQLGQLPDRLRTSDGFWAERRRLLIDEDGLAGSQKWLPEAARKPPATVVQLTDFTKKKKRPGSGLDQVASPISRLTVATFRASPTSIGCAPGRNQQYQWLPCISSHLGAAPVAGRVQTQFEL
jgi:hypothetical protein